MIDLDRIESAARAATPGKRMAITSEWESRGWVAIVGKYFICPSDAEAAIYDDVFDAAYIAAADPQTVLALVRIAKAAAEYEGLRNHPCIDRMTFEQWADIAGQRHAELLAALRDAGLL